MSVQYAARICIILMTAWLVYAGANIGLFSSLKTIQEELRYEFSSRAPTGDVAFLDIDSESLQHVGVWPWPRSIHAQILNRLIEYGAAEVAFDIDFSTKSDESEDAAFANALELAGGYAFLAAFDQVSGITGELEHSRPIDMFAQHADAVLVNVEPDQNGVVKSFPTDSYLSGEPVQSLATTFGYSQSDLPSKVLVDYRIDAQQIDRVSVKELLTGSLDPNRLLDKQIVVGASAIELRDFFFTPRFGVLPGPIVQILAIETIASGQILRASPAWINLVMAFFVLAAVPLLGSKLGIGVQLGFCTIFLVGLEACSLYLLNAQEQIFSTHVVTVLVLATLVADLLFQSVIWFRQNQVFQRRLEYLANRDVATGALSRAGFLDRVKSVIPEGENFTICLIQLDRLEIVRRTLGNEIADETAKVIAERLENLSKSHLGILAPGLFCIGLEDRLKDAEIASLSEQVLALVRLPVSAKQHVALVDAQLGFATSYAPGERVNDVIRHASIALAERTPLPNLPPHVFRYESAASTRSSHYRRLDIAMREAIARNEFRAAFQPQTKLASGELYGVEALIRWNSRQFGEVSPVDFVPLAEETGFIVELGRWMMLESCQIVAQWNWQGMLSVNLSPAQLLLDDAVGIITSTLAETGYPPEQLCVEITESMLVNDLDQTVRTFSRFRDLGISIAIDDFGTGFSSLSYLTKLPANKLKIDQSFIRALDADVRNAHVVASTISLARKLGLEVVAEGIETKDQLRMLTEMGCDIGQGYFIGKPVDARKLSKNLKIAPTPAPSALKQSA